MIDLQYGILFTLELLHKYYADQQCNDFVISASARTQSLLNGERIIIKQYSNTLYAGIQMGTGTAPFITPGPGDQYTFFLQLQNNLFFNYTNLPSTWPAGKLYYFSNRSANMANGKNFLTLPLSYNNGATYHPGDVVVDGAGTVYQSILTGTGNAPAAGSTYWTAVDKNQYLSETDALTWMPAISTVTFNSLQPSFTVNVFGYAPATKDYTQLLVNTSIVFKKPLPAYTLDLSILPPGKYKLIINGGTPQWIYLNDELSTGRPMAVVEIFNDAGIQAPFALLSGAGNLNSPLYSIYFLNRYAIWKYILTGTETGLVTDTSNVYKFTAAPAGTMYSLQPMPLTETILPLSLTIGTRSAIAPIPCPSPQRLVNYQPNPPSGDIYNCSEIYLNY